MVWKRRWWRLVALLDDVSVGVVPVTLLGEEDGGLSIDNDDCGVIRVVRPGEDRPSQATRCR